MNKIVLEQMIIIFLGRTYFTSNDGSQKIFVYQPILDTLELRNGKVTDYVLSWKSNGVSF